MLARLIIPGAAVVFLSVAALLQFGPGETALGYLVAALLGLLMGLAVVGAFLWRSGRWYVVPGGVVVRRFVLGPFGKAAHLYRPADSVLFIERAWGAWEATICRSYRCFSRSLTDVECAVLLAAWQSPLKLPALDELLGRG